MLAPFWPSFLHQGRFAPSAAFTLIKLAVLFGFQVFAQDGRAKARIASRCRLDRRHGRHGRLGWSLWSLSLRLLEDLLGDLLHLAGQGTPTAIFIALDAVAAAGWMVLHQGSVSPRAADTLPEFAVCFVLRSFAEDRLPHTAGLSGRLWPSLGSRWSWGLSFPLLDFLPSHSLDFYRLSTPA